MTSKDTSEVAFVHRFIPGKSKRTLLLLHGTGGDEDSLIPLAKDLDADASVLTVRGKVLENGMPRFFRRFAEGVFDLEDLRFRAGELADFLGWAPKKYHFTLESLTAVGYSNGANIGAGILLLRPEVLGSAVLLRATLPLKPDPVPNLTGKSIFVSAGRFDSMVPQAGTRSLVEILEEAGAKVILNWENSTHSLTREELEKAQSWLAGVA